MDRRRDTQKREVWEKRVLRYLARRHEPGDAAGTVPAAAATAGRSWRRLSAIVSAAGLCALLVRDLHGFEQALRLQAALGVGCDKECLPGMRWLPREACAMPERESATQGRVSGPSGPTRVQKPLAPLQEPETQIPSTQ